MKDNIHNKSMNMSGPRIWPQRSATHGGAYADIKNTDKYNSLTGLNTVIYGNFLWR